MATGSTDILMTFNLGSSGVAAECTAQWDQSDTMHKDFTQGCYFEIEDFTLSGGLESDDGDTDKTTGGGSGHGGGNSLTQRSTTPQKGNDQGNTKKGMRGNKFSKYVLEGSLKYTIDIQEISITRQMDKASPVLLDNCLKMTPFDKAVIVKRKVVGGVEGNTTANHRGFLRLEFEKPLITSIDWDDGEVVKEKLKFVCRGLTVIYLPQDNTGKLGKPVQMTYTPSRAIAGGSGR
ncbi:MAG TPA: type VI secretion system tube protein Hcp [Acetobacteraceae bacterium]|nr:type VI secretion system tube protein Hcp [Acetobacteraceae bacterium]